MLSNMGFLSSKAARIGLAAGVSLFVFIFYFQSSRILPPASHRPAQPEFELPHNCELNRSHLDAYKLSPSIQYARRYIHVYEQEDADHPSILDIPERLVPELQSVSLKQEEKGAGAMINLQQCERKPVQLRVAPIRPKADASGLLFGVSTKAERLKNSMPQFLHWLSGNHASLLALIAPDPSTRELQQQMRAAGIDVTIQHSSVGYIEAYFGLVESLYKEASRRPGTHWVSWMDDDTFFPSMNNLVDRLALYDSSKPQYIGALSEDMHQVRKHGYYGFGGGGIFVSMPLLKLLHEAYPKCKEHNRPEWGGDYQLYSCISNYTTTKMVVEHDLHQFDFFGDVRGVYEAGRPMLSLHHWKSWHHFDVANAVAISDLCGDSCLFQRYKFVGQNPSSPMVLTNGFSIVEYLGQTPDFMRAELTWNINNDEIKSGRPQEDILNDFAHSVGPLRPKLEEGKDKISYDLADMVRGTNGEFKQVYIHKGADGEDDRVIELIWLEACSAPSSLLQLALFKARRGLGQNLDHTRRSIPRSLRQLLDLTPKLDDRPVVEGLSGLESPLLPHLNVLSSVISSNIKRRLIVVHDLGARKIRRVAKGSGRRQFERLLGHASSPAQVVRIFQAAVDPAAPSGLALTPARCHLMTHTLDRMRSTWSARAILASVNAISGVHQRCGIPQSQQFLQYAALQAARAQSTVVMQYYLSELRQRGYDMSINNVRALIRELVAQSTLKKRDGTRFGAWQRRDALRLLTGWDSTGVGGPGEEQQICLAFFVQRAYPILIVDYVRALSLLGACEAIWQEWQAYVGSGQADRSKVDREVPGSVDMRDALNPGLVSAFKQALLQSGDAPRAALVSLDGAGLAPSKRSTDHKSLPKKTITPQNLRVWREHRDKLLNTSMEQHLQEFERALRLDWAQASGMSGSPAARKHV
ncbi:MAG: hypothetical protein M4579_004461 [Chaenotheca gracillima]|nr:MAG: hypothetical protein M4579_004461 [Chaenotheca gracillima]